MDQGPESAVFAGPKRLTPNFRVWGVENHRQSCMMQSENRARILRFVAGLCLCPHLSPTFGAEGAVEARVAPLLQKMSHLHKGLFRTQLASQTCEIHFKFASLGNCSTETSGQRAGRTLHRFEPKPQRRTQRLPDRPWAKPVGRWIGR